MEAGPKARATGEGTSKVRRFALDDAVVPGILAGLAGATLRVEQVRVLPRSLPPPLLYDLTELQRHANRLFGWSASRTLQVAQSLYEKHKLISYPRTDCRHLSREVAGTVPAVMAVVAPGYAPVFPPAAGVRPLGRRYIDDARVTDHHAIIPTTTRAQLSATSDEAKLYDLVVRRLLAAHMPDYRFTDTTAWFVHTVAEGQQHFFRASGKVVVDEGFRAIERRSTRAPVKEPPRLPPLSLGQGLPVADAGSEKKRTTPPPHLTDATLLTAMETAGQTVDDKALSEAMRARGLGTPATRAAIIETLLDRGYLSREGKTLRATEQGEQLVQAVHEHVKSPAMTGAWEHELRRVEAGEVALEAFLGKIEIYVTEVVALVRCRGVQPARPLAAIVPGQSATSSRARGEKGRRKTAAQPTRGRSRSKGAKASPASRRFARAGGAPERDRSAPARDRSAPARNLESGTNRRPAAAAVAAPAPSAVEVPCPLPERRARAAGTAGLQSNLQTVFGLDRLSATQQRAAERVLHGESLLVIMKAGAERSRCYQLPALCRGGTTLVISPLFVQLEDEVERLQRAGVRAERIHAGRGRIHSRAVCRAYLAGDLEFLFVSAEPFALPGFGPMLARRGLSLVVIDEAHHLSRRDVAFRSDYGLLSEHLAALPGAPRVALTATRNPAVHEDIISALGPAPLSLLEVDDPKGSDPRTG